MKQSQEAWVLVQIGKRQENLRPWCASYYRRETIRLAERWAGKAWGELKGLGYRVVKAQVSWDVAQ